MVKVFLSSNGQMKVTVPKALVEAMQWKHNDELEFTFKKIKVFLSKNGQMKFTVPKKTAEEMQLKHKDKVKFVFNNSKWEMIKQNE